MQTWKKTHCLIKQDQMLTTKKTDRFVYLICCTGGLVDAESLPHLLYRWIGWRWKSTSSAVSVDWLTLKVYFICCTGGLVDAESLLHLLYWWIGWRWKSTSSAVLVDWLTLKASSTAAGSHQKLAISISCRLPGFDFINAAVDSSVDCVRLMSLKSSADVGRDVQHNINVWFTGRLKRGSCGWVYCAYDWLDFCAAPLWYRRLLATKLAVWVLKIKVKF